MRWAGPVGPGKNFYLYPRSSKRPLEGLNRERSGQMSLFTRAATVCCVKIRVGTGLARENAEGSVGLLGGSRRG